jgi:hypothetical protein
VILHVARVAAHSVERPAAPVTTFLLGSAVAGGMNVNEAAAKIQALAATRATSAEEGSGSGWLRGRRVDRSPAP